MTTIANLAAFNAVIFTIIFWSIAGLCVAMPKRWGVIGLCLVLLVVTNGNLALKIWMTP